MPPCVAEDPVMSEHPGQEKSNPVVAVAAAQVFRVDCNQTLLWSCSCCPHWCHGERICKGGSSASCTSTQTCAYHVGCEITSQHGGLYGFPKWNGDRTWNSPSCSCAKIQALGTPWCSHASWEIGAVVFVIDNSSALQQGFGASSCYCVHWKMMKRPYKQEYVV